MARYSITWQIDVEASCHREAARIAHAVHKDPDSIATVFTVDDNHGDARMVDLWDLSETPIKD